MKRLGSALYLLAILSVLAFAMNLVIGPQWIEELLEASPDGGDGSLEALIMVAPAVTAIVLGGAGYLVRRRVQPA